MFPDRACSKAKVGTTARSGSMFHLFSEVRNTLSLSLLMVMNGVLLGAEAEPTLFASRGGENWNIAFHSSQRASFPGLRAFVHPWNKNWKHLLWHYFLCFLFEKRKMCVAKTSTRAFRKKHSSFVFPSSTVCPFLLLFCNQIWKFKVSFAKLHGAKVEFPID